MRLNLNWDTVSQETVRQFDEEGYLIVREALDADAVDPLTEAADRLVASDNLENRQTRDNGQYDGFRNCIALDDAFLPLLMHETVFPMVIQFLGAYLHLVTSHLIYKHPDPPGTHPGTRHPSWHRDYGRFTSDLGQAADVERTFDKFVTSGWF